MHPVDHAQMDAARQEEPPARGNDLTRSRSGTDDVLNHPKPIAAFFDVDDTLIAVKSIFRFLGHLSQAQVVPSQVQSDVQSSLQALAGRGVTRSTSLSVFFRVLAGLDETETADHGERWFATELGSGGLFNQNILRRFHLHAGAGHRTVLVSGSFPACLAPLGRYLNADAVLCSQPEVIAGRYTGAISQPLVDGAKADAIRTWGGADLARSYAYGDHESDLPMLESVGNPVVVGDDPTLTAHAARRGWSRLKPNDKVEQLHTLSAVPAPI